MTVLFCLIFGVAGLGAFYYYVVVPFQFWVARKIGCGYDPSTNTFTHGDFCQAKCWHRKYEVKP